MNETVLPPPSRVHQPTTLPARRSKLWLRHVRAGLARHLYAGIALPLSLVGPVAAIFGRAATIGRWQRALAHRLLAVPTPAASGPRSYATLRVIRHCLVSLPANVVAFVLVAPAWAVFMARGVFYPIVGADNLEQSWGGPTLAGAWFAHFMVGLPMLLLVTILLLPVSRLQAKLAARFVGLSSPQLSPRHRSDGD